MTPQRPFALAVGIAGPNLADDSFLQQVAGPNPAGAVSQ